jgi:hypothetical protein
MVFLHNIFTLKSGTGIHSLAVKHAKHGYLIGLLILPEEVKWLIVVQLYLTSSSESANSELYCFSKLREVGEDIPGMKKLWQ